MTIFCVVPVHNRIEMTLKFLDSLDKQTVKEPISVLVVDDGSTDGTERVLRDRNGKHHIHILTGTGDWWWGGSVWRAINDLRTKTQPDDWVFLANNDTILDPNYIRYLHETANQNDQSLVGGRSFEIWPDGTQHPVSSGFLIDHSSLSVLAIDGDFVGIREVDALAGRGILVPVSALARVSMQPRLMPQHFADLDLTSQAKPHGFRLLVDHRAESLQIDRASSALELGHKLKPSLKKPSPMFIPALTTFWWKQTPSASRLALPFKVLKRRAIGRTTT